MSQFKVNSELSEDELEMVSAAGLAMVKLYEGEAELDNNNNDGNNN